ncbi:MAG: tRNA pseudouridine(54/55) synthase Pus10 [Candidatus Lokiarchaeota archaeon]|nr:tRNA pseudouridine(54/55) synthase Pus10 [Candidatus Lokiarchaeota archaeon]
MSIFNKVLEIYKDQNICLDCLGRMFSLLGTHSTNEERGKSLLLSLTMENHQKYLIGEESIRNKAIENLKLLANKAKYIPAKEVLKKEGFEPLLLNEDINCFLCNNIFRNLDDYVEIAKKNLEKIEYSNFLIGTSPSGKIINREDKFKAKHNIIEAESFKTHMNREIGKKLVNDIGKPTEFTYPDLTIIYSIRFDKSSTSLIIRSLFIFGRYKKLIRGIPQTRWFCRKCNGNGCESCEFTGKQYETSVEGLISPEFINASQAESSKFHGAGREDIDVRMLGTGRPFILELRNPKIRTLDLDNLLEKVNMTNKDKIEINQLSYTNKKQVIFIKENAENTKKTYKAIAESSSELNIEEFQERFIKLINTFENKNIDQRTPHRVAHRRADKIRDKKLFKVEGKFLKPNLFEFIIESQGGTYIKELISGDEGRTSPSFSEILEVQLKCIELDVLNIDY